MTRLAYFVNWIALLLILSFTGRLFANGPIPEENVSKAIALSIFLLSPFASAIVAGKTNSTLAKKTALTVNGLFVLICVVGVPVGYYYLFHMLAKSEAINPILWVGTTIFSILIVTTVPAWNISGLIGRGVHLQSTKETNASDSVVGAGKAEGQMSGESVGSALRGNSFKGAVLDFSIVDGRGLISGDDGKRYHFVGKEWKASAPPRAGSRVDFVVNGQDALGVYVEVGA